MRMEFVVIRVALYIIDHIINRKGRDARLSRYKSEKWLLSHAPSRRSIYSLAINIHIMEALVVMSPGRVQDPERVNIFVALFSKPQLYQTLCVCSQAHKSFYLFHEARLRMDTTLVIRDRCFRRPEHKHIIVYTVVPHSHCSLQQQQYVTRKKEFPCN